MTSNNPIDNLLPSLVQCFGVMIIGYLGAKMSVISQNAQALGQYVTKFALPALFFRSMALIDFGNVNWMFILAVSLGKLIFFIVTVIITILITRPVNFGMAGILSMFITQSNDVALGYPILKSVYPNLAEYIYLFAPAQLVLINPFCFIMLEIHEYRSVSMNNNQLSISNSKRALLVLKKVLLNPLVFMTLIGVIFNFIINHKLPVIIDKLLTIFADSFAGVALFYLGMNMVGKFGKLNIKIGSAICLLVLGKLVLMPLIVRELVFHMVERKDSQNMTALNYSSMAFFYGGLPTAPPVFLIANDFQIIPDMIATGFVIVTFLSGPFMFITGSMMTMLVSSGSQYDLILKNTAFSISVISIFCSIWVLIIFIIARKWKCSMHKITMVYLTFILLSTVGLVLGWILLADSEINPNIRPGWGHYIQFSVFFIGVTGARLWTGLIAAALFIIKKYGISVLDMHLPKIFVVGFISPVLVTSILLLTSAKSRIKDIDPSFQYGKSQTITSLCILGCSIIISIIFLILQTRTEPTFQPISQESQERLVDDSIDSINLNDTDCSYRERTNDIEQLSDNSDNDDSNESNNNNEHHRNHQSTFGPQIDLDIVQFNRHLLLVIILLITMTLGFFLCLWRLINEQISGVYIELEFLDCVFNFSQGFITWALFGFDIKVLIRPMKRLINLWKNVNEFYIPPEGHLSKEVKNLRDDFQQFHMNKCKEQIVTTVRIKTQI